MNAVRLPEFRVRMFERVTRTASVASFRFKPYAPLAFKAGQFVKVLFDETNRQNKELNKYLSFSSAPARDYIEVTKRLSASEFSDRLRRLLPGKDVLLQGPAGRCVLPQAAGRIAFLVGGIGITPVISMLEDIVENHRPLDAVVLYSNRTPEEIAFKPELDFWQARRQNIRIVYTITDNTDPVPGCSQGRIDARLLRQCLPDVRERQLFIFGPPGMVTAMEQLCQEAGCEKEHIMAEKFFGYD